MRFQNQKKGMLVYIWLYHQGASQSVGTPSPEHSPLCNFITQLPKYQQQPEAVSQPNSTANHRELNTKGPGSEREERKKNQPQGTKVFRNLNALP